MSETNRLDELIEWLQGNQARIDLASAVAAGAGLGVMGYPTNPGSVVCSIGFPDRPIVDPMS